MLRNVFQADTICTEQLNHLLECKYLKEMNTVKSLGTFPQIKAEVINSLLTGGSL